MRSTAQIDPDTLCYPVDLVESVGLSRNEIGFLKRKGCPFYGKKTTLRWVRDFIAREAGAQPAPIIDREVA